MSPYFTSVAWNSHLAPVVQTLDIAIHWVNLYPVYHVSGFPDTYLAEYWFIRRIALSNVWTTRAWQTWGRRCTHSPSFSITAPNLGPRSPTAKGKGDLTFQRKIASLGTRLRCSINQYLKLFKATRKEKKSKKGLEVNTRELPPRRPRTSHEIKLIFRRKVYN